MSKATGVKAWFAPEGEAAGIEFRVDTAALENWLVPTHGFAGTVRLTE
jgi:hypothetical protein